MKDNKHQHRKPIKNPKNPDPMSNARTMGREGMRLIKNMAHGTFNMYNEGHVFRNIHFTNATINEIDKRLMDVAIHINAINFAYAGTDNKDVLRLLHQDTKAYEAYVMIREALVGVANTGDTGLLYPLIMKLPKYKYNI